MKLNLDTSIEYGLVLEGGGAKGSYQIGAWRALREEGIKIRGIAGTSVGALNGALICMEDLKKAEAVWEDISYSKVMDVDDDLIEKFKKRNLKALDLAGVLSDMKKVLTDRGIDITPLKQMIVESVDEEAVRTSGKDLFVTMYSVSDRELVSMNVASDETAPGTIGDMLLASAYLPVFKHEKLQGKRYLDGGGFDNVPVDVLLKHGYKNIIVIRIYGLGFDSEKVTEIPEHVNLWHIAPRQDLGGILEFDRKKARRNMLLGYYDAKRMMYGLNGKMYYIEAPESEAYYVDRMMSETELLKIYLKFELEITVGEEELRYRDYTEKYFPCMAQTLKLKEDWNYRDLYVGMVEDMARRLRFNRFRIYSVEELVRKIYVKVKRMDGVLLGGGKEQGSRFFKY